MTREAGALVMAGVALLVLLLMLIAWRRRARRDSALVAPQTVPQGAETLLREEVLYVATTRHDEPLERLALRPLTYRARGEVTLTDQGIALSIDGAPTVFLESAHLIGIDRSTWTIDRVVERDGLVRIAWRVADDTIVDSYLRLVSGAVTTFVARATALVTPPSTGAKA